MSLKSVHDNYIQGYEVDGLKKRIVLHTYHHDGKTYEDMDIVFEGVFAYRFECDNLTGNLISCMEEVSFQTLIDWEAPSFEYGLAYGWPGFWGDGIPAAIEQLEKSGGRVFYLQSSTGLWGWVVATSCLIDGEHELYIESKVADNGGEGRVGKRAYGKLRSESEE